PIVVSASGRQAQSGVLVCPNVPCVTCHRNSTSCQQYSLNADVQHALDAVPRDNANQEIHACEESTNDSHTRVRLINKLPARYFALYMFCPPSSGTLIDTSTSAR
ncbi:unnamed protein product, partial [Ectocarpus sp. 12 AP-2014]